MGLKAQPFSVDSNVQRELAFNLEHAIHHQALIKIGLNQLGQHMESGFGVAPSTLRSMATVQLKEHSQEPQRLTWDGCAPSPTFRSPMDV